MSVSVPEKTLEHWASQYITYRYRSKAALWWPTNGEDIGIQALPSRPGKAVRLELKTTTPSGPNHDVTVDLGQLWEYLNPQPGTISLAPFYVFPNPPWQGSLITAATNLGHSATEFAFGRSQAWWFAEWMVVLPTAEVAGVLSSELKAHGSPTRGKRVRLVRFDAARLPIWGHGKTASPPPQHLTKWRDFWPELEMCGRSGWPQLIRVPSRLLQAGQLLYTRAEMLRLLTDAKAIVETGDLIDDPLSTFSAEADGFRIVSSDRLVEVNSDEVDDHGQVVFLHSRAILNRNT